MSAEYIQSNTDTHTPNLTHATHQTIPAVTLKAVGFHAHVALHEIGKPTVLIFCTRETSDISETICRKVDSVYDLITQVFVASVVNLEVVPWPFRFIAESAMRNVYHELVAKLPARLTDKEYIYILPDWYGSVTKAMGLHNVHHTAAIVVLDAAGTIVGVHQGAELTETMMAWLAHIINNP